MWDCLGTSDVAGVDSKIAAAYRSVDLAGAIGVEYLLVSVSGAASPSYNQHQGGAQKSHLKEHWSPPVNSNVELVVLEYEVQLSNECREVIFQLGSAKVNVGVKLKENKTLFIIFSFIVTWQRNSLKNLFVSKTLSESHYCCKKQPSGCKLSLWHQANLSRAIYFRFTIFATDWFGNVALELQLTKKILTAVVVV